MPEFIRKEMLMMRRWIYAGSFDPPTKGHLDIIMRAASLCDELIVGVMVNVHKQPLFTLEERVEMLRLCTLPLDNVRVVTHQGLLVAYAREHQCQAIVRGLRNVADFDNEAQQAHVNRHLGQNIETVLLYADPANSWISSSAVREAAMMGAELKDMVPAILLEAISQRLRHVD